MNPYCCKLCPDLMVPSCVKVYFKKMVIIRRSYEFIGKLRYLRSFSFLRRSYALICLSIPVNIVNKFPFLILKEADHFLTVWYILAEDYRLCIAVIGLEVVTYALRNELTSINNNNLLIEFVLAIPSILNRIPVHVLRARLRLIAVLVNIKLDGYDLVRGKEPVLDALLE